MDNYLSYHKMALAHQYVRHVLGRVIVTDIEYDRIKGVAINSLPEDEQTQLKDITPSTLASDYSDETKEIAMNLCAIYDKNILLQSI